MSISRRARLARRFGLLVPAMFVATGTAALTLSPQVAQAASSSPTLSIIADEPTSGFDPNIAVTQASIRVMELMYDTLLDYNAQGDLVPDLAKSWSLSSNGLTYTFHLQPHAEFSNGDKITAQDVEWSLHRMATGAALKSEMTDMKSVSVVNPTTFQIHLTSPSRVFLASLATVGSSAILDQAAVTANPKYFTQPIDTSGPWVLSQYTPGVNLTLTANPDYWHTGYPKIKTIQYTFSEDVTSAVQSLQSGTEDMYYPIDPQDAIRLAKSDVTKTYVSDQPGIVGFGFDKSKPPFNNVDVRQALAYMAPRADKLKICWDGIGAVSYGNIVYPGSWAYTPGVGMYNVSAKVALQRASKLMTEAGWVLKNGVRVAENVKGVPNGTPFKYNVPVENDWNQAECNTLLLQHDEAPLGVKLIPQNYDGATFWTQVGKTAFLMYHEGDGWATPDQEFEQAYTCAGQANNLVVKWCDPAVDKLIAQAGATSSLKTAAALYHKVQVIVEQQVPNIVTGVQYSVTSASVNLHGYYSRPDDSNRSLIAATLSS
jgi:peptide/nickel transport system substrate-binding protein